LGAIIVLTELIKNNPLSIFKCKSLISNVSACTDEGNFAFEPKQTASMQNALNRNKQESHFVSNPVILNNQDILVIEIN